MDQASVSAILVIVVTIIVILGAYQEREIRQLRRTLDKIYASIIGEISEPLN